MIIKTKHNKKRKKKAETTNATLAHTPHRVPIIPVVVVQVLTPGIEVQFPRVGGRVPRSRPIVAVRAYVVHGRIVAVTGGGFSCI